MTSTVSATASLHQGISKDDHPDRGREGLCTLDHLHAYRIADFDRLDPFLISLLSEGDFWCYISSRFGLTAGRIEPTNCLFPYTTDNELHLVHPHTGPITTGYVRSPGQPTRIWTPLRDNPRPFVRRHLSKTILSDRLLAEEEHQQLGLRYSMRLAPTATLGLIRTVTVTNESDRAVDLDLLDGYIGLLPAGFNLGTLHHGSCLVDAYTQAEIDPQTGLAMLALTVGIADTSIPVESLYANTAWATDLQPDSLTLDPAAITAFRRHQDFVPSNLRQGRRSAYLARRTFTLEPGHTRSWHVALDAKRTQTQVSDAMTRLRDEKDIEISLERALEATSRSLQDNVNSADAMQVTGSPIAATHHAANVLFNNARGGVPVDAYHAPCHDILDFIRTRHKAALPRFSRLLEGHASIDILTLQQKAIDSESADDIRLAFEYLPLTFGRRHGDPSRPWNHFSIRVQDENGQPVLNHQGNWRDIFQNWEAMALSFPAFLPSMIARFLNASTPDGFNPYRITRDGIDWEKPNPDDPWAYIGYWGDHQLVYLVRLLEHLADHDPGQLLQMTQRNCYAYANVPYRIKPYKDLLANPNDTIIFDAELDRQISRLVKTLGTDARLCLDEQQSVVHVGFVEKLLVPLLSKLSNLVPDGGIWMNTQRPEWNDANNALAGNGLSVVTLAYLHRYACFVRRLLDLTTDSSVSISSAVVDWLDAISVALSQSVAPLRAGLSSKQRRQALDRFGLAFERYRHTIASSGLGRPREVATADIRTLLDRAIEVSEFGVRANLRSDGLIHSYNTLHLHGDAADIRRLPLMLEGQVAALSAGIFSPDQNARILDVLFESELYREDQKSFILYPRRTMPSFLEKATISPEVMRKHPVLRQLLEDDVASIIQADRSGQCYFAGNLKNHAALDETLDGLAGVDLSDDQREQIHEAYEQVFHHHEHTGRSGSMFAYEGNGSVYWHMISKLLLATQEVWLQARQTRQATEITDRLMNHYTRIREGLGFNKPAAHYGAFPLDPYSHTPWARGAQQPGMTGQVKEEILTRRTELGVSIIRGIYHFDPASVDPQELLVEPMTVSLGHEETLELQPGSLLFTLCQVPVIYTLDPDQPEGIELHRLDQSITHVEGTALDALTSRAIRLRQSDIHHIIVNTKPAASGSSTHQ